MNNIRVFLVFIFVFTLGVNNVSASRVSKANKALLIKDYFKAKKHFSKGVKYNISPSSFGLATIYSRNDNPFFNLDSAYHYIVQADSTWGVSSDRKKKKWAIYSWTLEGIDSLKNRISDQLFIKAKGLHTVEAYSDFINRNAWSKDYELAIHKRDSLAFFSVVTTNDANSYKEFLRVYPNSEYGEIAKENYHNSQFLEMTVDKSLESYKIFVKEYPNSPQRLEADSIIYYMVTQNNTEEAYRDFVLNYSENTFIKRGWEKFYQVYLFDYSKSRILEFQKLYPQALNILDIEKDIVSFSHDYLPFIKNGEYGIMNSNGEVVVQAAYQYIGSFEEGFAQYMENDRVGLMNTRGVVFISAKYDNISTISNGRYIVEKNELLGLIDRNGKEIFPCKYEDIGELSEGLVYIAKEDSYVYSDYNGQLKDSLSFLDAMSFNNGLAKVETETGIGIINSNIEFVIPPFYNNLKWLNDSLLSYSEGRKFGVINLLGDTIVNLNYDYIGDYQEGLALVSFNDTVNYIDERGKVAIGGFFQTYPNYKSKGSFVNGSAIIVRAGKYGRINNSGDIVSEIQYDNLGEGAKYIPFEKKNAWGVMSLSNKIMIPSKYESINVINDKMVITKFEDSIGLVDLSGKVLIPNSFKSIEFLGRDIFSVYNGDKFGLFIDGVFITPLEYKAISLLNDRFVTLMDEISISYFDMEKKQIVKRIEEGE